MNEAIRIVSNLILASIIITIFGAIITSYIDNHYGYDYITMKDERGIASKCYMNKKGIFCKINGDSVEVKQYGKR